MRAEVRHQLKHDKFAEATAETVSWAVEHRKTLITAGVVGGVIVAVVLGGFYYLQTRDEAASLAMAQAFRSYDAPIVAPGTPAEPGVTTFSSMQDRAKAAQAQFRSIAAKYPHTRSGEIAHYFAALTDEDLGNTAAAERELKDLASGHNQDLAPLAKFALANLYRTSGRDKQAIELYKQLIDHPSRSVSKAEAQLELAATYAGKQPAEARKLYEQIRKDNPTSAAAEIASNRLSALK